VAEATRQLAGREQQPATDLNRSVDPRDSFGIGGDVRTDGIGQLAQTLKGGTGRVGRRFGAAQSLDTSADEGR